MSDTDLKADIIQYVPYTSFVQPSFWHTLTEMKLDVDKLSERTKQIHGRFTYRDDIGPIFEVDGTSFNTLPQHEQFYSTVTGTVMNKNTVEEFRSLDKASLLNSVGEIVMANLKKKSWISNPSCLLNFFILSFADLKKFHYYYWFAFPAPSQPTVYLKEKSAKISSEFNNKQLEDLAQKFKALGKEQRPFFTVTKENDDILVKTLSEALNQSDDKLEIDFNNIYFVFTDPNNGSNPGWPLRTLLAALLDSYSNLKNTIIKVIGLRITKTGSFENSIIFNVSIPEDAKPIDSAGWVGWERNDKGNFGPRLANMSASMDPVILADASSDLNLKLMKWRLVPNIDVEIMKNTKCLLIGAGTLGCHVARDLLAWGFRHITFLDNGKVSYNNPTRQVLFNFQDCLGGGRRKAEAAADNLKLILPTVNTKGVGVHIPMPGHPIGESMKEETNYYIDTLRTLINEHDVLFLLLDTREARWLPSLIAAHSGKIVINAALGFDSYLVMRHGIRSSPPQEGADINKVFIDGDQLGCYFCNDVTAPGNSLKDRTLDQQCTVTRPGVAAIAGAWAVELLVSLLQHPLGAKAPAPYNMNNTDQDIPPEIEGVLGPIPHSLRGFLHSYQTVLPTCAKFKQCIACSDVVINKYNEEGLDFLFNVFNSGTYLEQVSGLSELHLSAEMNDILTLTDDDD